MVKAFGTFVQIYYYLFLQCYLFVSILRTTSHFLIAKIDILLSISSCTAVFSLPSCTRRNIFEEFEYPLHAVALLSLLMTEVPSCPLSLPTSTV